MNEPSSDVLIERARLTPGAGHNLAWSVLAHAVLLGAVVAWPRSQTGPALRNVMTINLSGAPGPATGGMTQMGGAEPAPVQPAPPAPPPPAARPTPAARPAVPVKPPPRETAPSQRPASTPEPTEGNTPVVTGARGQGFGLSSSGSNSAGRNVELDVANFCCPDYIERVVLVIQRNWDRAQGVRGAAVVSLTIHRDGSVDGVAVTRPSGFYALDNAALRAIARAQLPALPAQFTDPTLTLRITFEYQ
jgi:TonB family protein